MVEQTFHGKVVIHGHGKKVQVQLPPEEARVRAVAEVVQALINGVRDGNDVNLNSLKMAASSKYMLPRAPKLVEIIAAVPEEYRNVLLPQLRAEVLADQLLHPVHAAISLVARGLGNGLHLMQQLPFLLAGL